MNYLIVFIKLCLNGIGFFFRFLCPSHTQVGQSTEQAAKEENGSLE